MRLCKAPFLKFGCRPSPHPSLAERCCGVTLWVYWGLTRNVVFCWPSDLISHKHTHIYTHTDTDTDIDTQHTQGPANWHTHINIYLHRQSCAHSSYLFYIEWTIHWYLNFAFHFAQCLSFSKIIHLLKPYQLIRCYKTRFFLWNTNNTDRNAVNKQNTHTKHSEKDNPGKGKLAWKKMIPRLF